MGVLKPRVYVTLSITRPHVTMFMTHSSCLLPMSVDAWCSPLNHLLHSCSLVVWWVGVRLTKVMNADVFFNFAYENFVPPTHPLISYPIDRFGLVLRRP